MSLVFMVIEYLSVELINISRISRIASFDFRVCMARKPQMYFYRIIANQGINISDIDAVV